MPLLSRDQTFAYPDCRELAQKLEREIDRYREVVGRDEDEPEGRMRLVDQLKDSAFNAAVTAWHLCDWVFNDMTLAQRQKLNFKSVTALQEYCKANCRALHLCRQAATASKHWVVSNKPDPGVQVIVKHDETGWIVLFVDQEKEQPADDVFESALSFWDHFISDNGIGKALDEAEYDAAMRARDDAQES